MADQDARSVKRLSDPRALRALAHPTRLSLLGMLRSAGPLTATQAGEQLGESSASCSFHLRQLAKYGLVEEAGGGTGRQRPWRATAMITHVPTMADSPEFAAASGLYQSVVAERYFEWLRRWLEASPAEPAQWQDAALFGDAMLYLTAAELAELGRQVRLLLDRYLDRDVRPELRPPDARLVSFLRLAFPLLLRGPDQDGPDQDGPGGSPAARSGR